jgi:hypothetical protein
MGEAIKLAANIRKRIRFILHSGDCGEELAKPPNGARQMASNHLGIAFSSSTMSIL